MAVGERCPACGHMPGEELFKSGPGDWAPMPEPISDPLQLIVLAVDLTRAATTPGHTGDEIAAKLATLHTALQGLTRAEKPADTPA